MTHCVWLITILLLTFSFFSISSASVDFPDPDRPLIRVISIVWILFHFHQFLICDWLSSPPTRFLIKKEKESRNCWNTKLKLNERRFWNRTIWGWFMSESGRPSVHGSQVTSEVNVKRRVPGLKPICDQRKKKSLPKLKVSLIFWI